MDTNNFYLDFIIDQEQIHKLLKDRQPQLAKENQHEKSLELPYEQLINHAPEAAWSAPLIHQGNYYWIYRDPIDEQGPRLLMLMGNRLDR